MAQAMIEKASRAMCAKASELMDGFDYSSAPEYVRAVLTAIRDLPDDIITEASEINFIEKSAVKGVWFACIDSILAGE